MEGNKDWNLTPLNSYFYSDTKQWTQGSVAIAKRTQKTLYCEMVHLSL